MTGLPARSGRLEAHGVGMTFRSGFGGRTAKVALARTSLAIGGERPAITAVVGESGSGKTTLTRLLLGLQPPSEGSVTYRGTDLRRLTRAGRKAFRREVQAVFQDPFDVFNPFYPVDHPLFTPLSRFGIANDRDHARALIEAALERVGLRPAETLGRHPHQLSGGQRQRIMIARALLLDPQIILADEPVSMVDASLRATILQLLLRLKDESGISLVYVTHDLTTAYQIADTVVVLYAGRIVEAGDVEAVIRTPRHPYTQALIDAIPSPDPDIDWGLDTVEPHDAAPSVPNPSVPAPSVPNPFVPVTGCAFAPRCPHVRPACTAAEPPLVQTDPDRQVRCLLFADAA